MVQLMKTGEYDGVSASGDATLRLIAGGDVAAVNTDLIPNYANVFEGLKNQPHNTVDGVAYGVPHGRGANLLMFSTDGRHAGPGQLERRLRRRRRVQGQGHRLRLRDLHRRRRGLPDGDQAGPRDHRTRTPSTTTQFAGRRRPAQGPAPEHHARTGAPPRQQIDAFTSGDMVVGTTWQYQVERADGARRRPGQGHHAQGRRRPAGPTRWMISSKAKHPNCMYKWMDYIISPEANADGDRALR